MDSKDLVVVGGGPGGYTAAIRASQLGFKVTLIEKESLGGVCLNWGCIPTKSLLHHAEVVQSVQKCPDLGIEIKGFTFDFSKFIDNSRQVVSKLTQGVAYLMKKNKVEVIFGQASFESEDSIVVKTKETSLAFKFEHCILAVGAKPRDLGLAEVDGEVIHNYRTILVNKIFPKSLIVVGAGPIGLEFSYFFSTLGCRVTLLEVLPRIAPLEDVDVSEALLKAFEENGVRVLTQSKIDSVERTKEGVVVKASTSSGELREISAEMLLFAAGVTPNTRELECEKAGILTNSGFISVNENYQTTNPRVFAIGDCIGGAMLAHKASHEAQLVCERLAGKNIKALSKEFIPSCIYCQPEVASVGLTEEQIKAKGLNYKAFKFPFSAIGKAVATFDQDGFCKVLVDTKYGEILGVHIVGHRATELIGIANLARTHEATAESLLETVFPHPTLSEVIPEAIAAAIGRPINF